MPCSNDEYFPPPPSREQLQIMELAGREAERMRRKFNMSRRAFVRSAMIGTSESTTIANERLINSGYRPA